MTEACILFAHHANDPVTRFNLEQLRRHNQFPIIPLRNQSDEGVEGSIRPPYDEPPWHGTDGLIYSWFRERTVDAERYIFIEWDCLMTMPVREYYMEVWESHAAACQIFTPLGNPHWIWFRELDALPSKLRASAVGIAPLNGVLLSREALTAVTSALIPPNVFSELRLGTLLKTMNIRVDTIPAAKASTNSFKPFLTHYDPTRPGLYHPIKSLEPTAFAANDLMPNLRILKGMAKLGALAMHSCPEAGAFSKGAARNVLREIGWATAEIEDVLHYLRDSGILTETPSNEREFVMRFKVLRIAELLASHAANEEITTMWTPRIYPA